MSKIHVNTKFDGGSIEVVDISRPQNLLFKIRYDTNSKFRQWFYFQLVNVLNKDINITLTGLKDTSFPDGWENYNVCISYDNQYWFRLNSKFDGSDNLIFNLKPTSNSVYFAYFEPYSYSRHLELIGFANQYPKVVHNVLGLTNQGRNIDLLVVGQENAKYKVWITARQHPGETMAEWFMEGLIHKLLDFADSTSNNLLKQCVFYLVPNMNPDGAYLGNLRVNSKGINLNREWHSPSLELSPEVYYVREKMMQTSVDVFFDIHGDESLPYVFTDGCQNDPSVSDKQRYLANKFIKYFELINPDYQTVHGYEDNHFGVESSSIATYWVGNKFDCLSFTLEMPFKDNANLPDVTTEWNGERSYLLGQSLLTTLNSVMRFNVT